MKIQMIFTNDWELFGDGSGDFYDLQDRALHDFLDAFEAEGARLTVMAEVGQQWAHKKSITGQSWCRRIAAAWEDGVRMTIRRGHDVQMHFHPQWVGAALNGKEWQLDMEKWEVGGIDDSSLMEVLIAGKRYLESLLVPVREDYRCVCFRAGGFRTEPSEVLIRALCEVGFICDSSVVKGLCHDNYYDYRDAYSHVMPWPVAKKSLKYRGVDSGLVEMPVCSVRSLCSPFLRSLFGNRSKSQRLSPDERAWFTQKRETLDERYPIARRVYTAHKVQYSWVARIFRRLGHYNWRMLDYDSMSCVDFLSAVDKMLSHAKRARWRKDTECVPIVAIGHTKAVHNPDQAVRIIRGLRSRYGKDCEFSTLVESADTYRSQLNELRNI